MPQEYLSVVSDDDYNRIGRRLFCLAREAARKQGVDVESFGFDNKGFNERYEAFSMLGNRAVNEDGITFDKTSQVRFMRHQVSNQLTLLYCLESMMLDCPIKRAFREISDKAASILRGEK